MSKPIDRRVQIGHVQLTVADLERAISFYSGVLGFELIRRIGQSTAFLSAGGPHHQIVLRTEGVQGPATASDRPSARYRFSIRYPDRPALGDALRRLRQARTPIETASDHGFSEALSVQDPDGNLVELYWDKPRGEWPKDAGGALTPVTRPLDEEALLAAAAAVPAYASAAGSQYALMTDANRTRLRDLRGKLLQLHKVLLDDTRAAYEMDRGRVPSNATLLQLVINDPWFAWLHSLSELVVRIDQTVEPDSPATDADAAALIDQVEKLLTASESGDGFHRRYFDALQRQPAVVMAHADVRRAIKAMR
jgi:catechol 2,3-dioxygenase